MKKILTCLSFLILLFLINPTIIYAQPDNVWGSCGTNVGVNTALGCIPINFRDFSAWLIGRGIGIAGGIAFLLMAYAGFMIIMSSGDPQRLQAGRELLTAAISGLLLIICSIFILKVIGIDILNIPGF